MMTMHDHQVGKDIGPDLAARQIDQHQGAGDAAHHAGGAQQNHQAPVDIAVQDVRGAGGGGGEQLGRMDAGRCVGRGNAARQQHDGGYDAVTHAERTVDQLGEKSDQREHNKIRHAAIPPCGGGNAKRYYRRCAVT
jgi:hypothetical protein